MLPSQPKTKNNHEINRRNHKGVNTNRKGTNLNIYDRYSNGGQEKISQGYNPLGSILKRRLPQPQPPNKNKYKNKYKYSNNP